jgi:hypothetical protein
MTAAVPAPGPPSEPSPAPSTARPPSAGPEPVARLSSPSEIAALVPHLVGFVPEESLVLVSLRGRRSRVGLTMRIDLPKPEDEDELVDAMVERLRFDGARRAVLVVHTEAEDDVDLPRAILVERLGKALEAAGIATSARLLVRAGRWHAYDCRSRCCPPEGTPLDSGRTPALRLVAAHKALGGEAVLPSRADLVRSLAPPTCPEVADRLTAAARERLRRVRAEGRVAVGREALRLWRRAVDLALDGEPEPSPERASALVVSLSDVLVRDEVLTWALGDGDALLALLLRLAARSAAPWDAPVCGLIAWVAHTRGDGGLANVALDRALTSDPAHSMSRLCREALDAQVPPEAVRSLLTDARAVLRQQHPWTGSAER